jgi:hypothetical protein
MFPDSDLALSGTFQRVQVTTGPLQGALDAVNRAAVPGAAVLVGSYESFLRRQLQNAGSRDVDHVSCATPEQGHVGQSIVACYVGAGELIDRCLLIADRSQSMACDDDDEQSPSACSAPWNKGGVLAQCINLPIAQAITGIMGTAQSWPSTRRRMSL